MSPPPLRRTSIKPAGDDHPDQASSNATASGSNGGKKRTTGLRDDAEASGLRSGSTAGSKKKAKVSDNLAATCDSGVVDSEEKGDKEEDDPVGNMNSDEQSNGTREEEREE